MESVLSVFGLSVPSLMAIVVSLSIIVVTLVIVIVVYGVIFPLIIRIGKFVPSSFGRMVIQGLKVPLVLYLGLLGVYLSITLPFDIGAFSYISTAVWSVFFPSRLANVRIFSF